MGVFGVWLAPIRAHSTVHVVMCASALTAVRLIDDHRETLVAQVGNAIDNEGEFLDRRSLG